MAALKKMPAKDFEKYQERIIELFGKTSVLTQTYILKKMPETVFNQPENRKQFYVHFKSLEATSQTILIEKLKKDYNEEIELVASSLGTLHKNQVKLFLKKIERAALTPTLRDKLENYAQINATYSYLVQQFLAQ
jgi:hypothetical protein